jgi:hypothetical protein
MQTIDSFMERRKHQRFQLKPGAYAVLSPNLIKLGQIIDISESGLSFRYIRYRTGKHDDSDSDVLLYGKNMYVDKIPFQVVADVELSNPGIFSSVLMNKFSVSFKKLSQEQIKKINLFINNHVVDE